jgi:hypothetical protein
MPPGVLHHVMVRAIERRPLFPDEQDQDGFVAHPWQRRIAHWSR